MTSGTYGLRRLSRHGVPALVLFSLFFLAGCNSSHLTLHNGVEEDKGSLVQSDHALAYPSPAAENLWQRLQRNFSLEASHHKEVAQQRAQLLKHPNHLIRTQEQALPYIGYVLDEIERRGLPGELALVPMIESGYKPKARSPSRAAGLWQFIPATGRAFGLSSSRWYEGRQDVAESTRAALDYFTRINQEFNNDWELTLAAYNAGEPAIRRAIYKNRKQGKPTDFWSLDLPRETRNYVPKLLALKHIFEQPERYGVQLLPIDAEQQLEVVDLHSPTDLGLVAKLAEIGMDSLRKLNPGFKSWFTGLDGPHRLLLPSENAEQLHQRLAAVPSEGRLRIHRHRVIKGDTLIKLASHYNSDVELIKVTNKLKSNKLRVSSTLLIPSPYPVESITMQPAGDAASRKIVSDIRHSKPAS